MTNNEANREKLANDMVEAWDLNDLTAFAVNQVEENLANCDKEEFTGEWKRFYAED